MTNARATAKDLMSAPPIAVASETRLGDVTRLMRERGVGCVLVLNDDGSLAGLITETDLAGIRRSVPFSLALAPVIYGARAPTPTELQKMLDAAGRLTARDVMTTDNVVSVPESTPVGELVHLMLDKGLKHVPVLRAGKPVGVVARHDLLKLIP